MARGDFVESFLDQLADAFIERLSDRVGLQMKNGKAATKAAGPRGRGSPMKGRKLNMDCRFPGCPNRSKGPKFHFLCDKHLKNPGWPAAKKAIEKAAKA